MKNLKVKSIVIIVMAILISNNVFAQTQIAPTSLEYTDKAEFFEGQKTHALKINFAGNFIGTTKISYEQILKPGRSFEVKATLVDGGEHSIFGSVGYKFYKKPTFIAPNMQRRNILEGTYFKPEIFAGVARFDGIYESSSEAEPTLGLVLNIGKQWMIGDFFVIDAYVGTGVASGSHVRGYLANEGLLLTSGINFGFAF